MSDGQERECPLPSRRAVHHTQNADASVLHPAPPVARRSSVHAKKRSWSAQATKVGMIAGAGVGVLTLTTPLALAASSWQSGGDTEKVAGVFSAGDSWIESNPQSADIVAADDLTAVQGAASRAKVRTPVEVSACVLGTQPANGERTITPKQVIYWPLQEGSYNITSDFSWRISPISGETLMHEGIDMAAKEGLPIYAVADGVVDEVDSNSRSGGYVVIRHQANDGTVFFTAYLHQYPEDISVAKGDKVKANQIIGAVGNAGWSTGAHLHFEVRNAQSQPVDPVSWMDSKGAVFVGEDCP